MHLSPASSDLQMIKEEILQYSKDLIASIKNNHALVKQSFHSALFGDEDLKHHTLHLEILSIGKDISRRTLFKLAGEASIGYC